MNTQQPNVATPQLTPTQIRRQLLKSQGELVVGAIYSAIAYSQANYAKHTAPPHVGRAADDRIFGNELKENYQAGISGRVVESMNAIRQELNQPALTQSDIGIYVYPDLHEFLSDNTTVLKRIAETLSRLTGQL